MSTSCPEFEMNIHPRPVGRSIADRRIELLGDPTEFMGTNAYVRPATGDDRVAIISDVHANIHALEAVLSAIKTAGINRIWCLGDTTGYGANPVECLRLVRKHCELVLAGNHDLAVIGDETIEMFGHHARPGVLHAQRALERASDGATLREWLALRLTEVADANRSIGYDLTFESQLMHHCMDAMRFSRVVAAHAAPSPFDSVWDYVGIDLAPELLAQNFRVPLILVGHSHRQFAWDGARMHKASYEIELPGSPAPWDASSPTLPRPVVANPGSVGQPRDGDPRAAWVELDESGRRLIAHRAEYDVVSAAEAMVDAGLPRETASRLATGR